MKPFNLERMLAGDPVICKNGKIPSHISYSLNKNDIEPITIFVAGDIRTLTRDGQVPYPFYGEEYGLLMQDEEVKRVPFNLDRMIRGDYVICRNGYVPINLCYYPDHKNFPVCFKINGTSKSCTREGKINLLGIDEFDLFMAYQLENEFDEVF